MKLILAILIFLLGAAGFKTAWAGAVVPGLGTAMGTDLIRWHERPKTNSPEELSQSFSQMFLEQVYLKNFMKTPELFSPDQSEESVVPPASPMYGELMRQALAKQLAKSDRLNLNAKLKPYFEKRQRIQLVRSTAVLMQGQ